MIDFGKSQTSAVRGSSVFQQLEGILKQLVAEIPVPLMRTGFSSSVATDISRLPQFCGLPTGLLLGTRKAEVCQWQRWLSLRGKHRSECILGCFSAQEE